MLKSIIFNKKYNFIKINNKELSEKNILNLSNNDIKDIEVIRYIYPNNDMYIARKINGVWRDSKGNELGEELFYVEIDIKNIQKDICFKKYIEKKRKALLRGEFVCENIDVFYTNKNTLYTKCAVWGSDNNKEALKKLYENEGVWYDNEEEIEYSINFDF